MPSHRPAATHSQHPLPNYLEAKSAGHKPHPNYYLPTYQRQATSYTTILQWPPSGSYLHIERIAALTDPHRDSSIKIRETQYPLFVLNFPNDV